MGLIGFSPYSPDGDEFDIGICGRKCIDIKGTNVTIIGIMKLLFKINAFHYATYAQLGWILNGVHSLGWEESNIL